MTSLLKADDIQDSSGNNIIKEAGDVITIGASGDTIDIPSGATLDATGATITGALTNTPAFMAVLGSDDTLPNSVFTKATFDTEVFDTNSAFASDKFTVPANEDGKYIFFGHILCYDIDDTNIPEVRFANICYCWWLNSC